MAADVTLQISLAPTDLPHASVIVPHQLRQWAGQVDEILFVLDLHRSNGRFAAGWEERLPGMRALIAEWCEEFPHARAVDVDYAPEARRRVADAFFAGAEVPAKEHRGGPFYSYFYAMLASGNDLVFHLDCDMFFGGGSQTWVDEAVAILDERPDVLACNPLPGPPTADGSLRSQTLERDTGDVPAFRYDAISTRLFLLDRRRLSGLRVERPPRRQALGAIVDGNPPVRTAEIVMSQGMSPTGPWRLDFAGRDPGVWSVHPPFRNPLFYERLPALVAAFERGDVPEAQRGCHELEDCMVDWSDVRPTRRTSIENHSRLLLRRVLRPVGR
ncbi:MAG TPA: hypothetical protein VFJ85_00105 [Acidimicrobiales bacterium]|nr:hypothetical protein [Acidimicrobiales bacterium]